MRVPLRRGWRALRPRSGVKKAFWRLGVAVVGGAVLLGGLLLIFLPGPSILVIPLGLAILALEFSWARVWLKKFRTLTRWVSRWRRDRRKKARAP